MRPALHLRAAATLLAAAVLLPAAARSHQQKEALTRVLFNERTGNIEVMHRFLLHDAEHAVRQLFEKEADILASQETRDRFEAYVHERFSMAADGEALPLEPVGNEVEGRFLWVYAETPIPDPLTQLTLTHGALRDLWPEQVNLVNVERGEVVRTALFRQGNDEISVLLVEEAGEP